jgi:hypothetical protein
MRPLIALLPPTLLAAVFLAAGCSLAPGGAAARTLQVGPTQTYKTPSAAIAEAMKGDHIVIAPGEYFDCAVVGASNVTIEGSGKPEDTSLTDKACQGKALLVTTGDNITIRNLTLTRARVPDGNGAGIRAEGRDLTIDNVRFVNNQDGILTTDQPDSTITITNSAFLQNGVCNQACSHGIYVGHIKLLHVENTRFFETKQGHSIKSRALRTEVIHSDIEDGPNGTSSYQIEVPNGGALVVRDTTMEKGPKSENHSIAISIGAEGVTQRTSEITIENNTLQIDGPFKTVLVNNLTATEAKLVGNKIPSSAKALNGDGSVK